MSTENFLKQNCSELAAAGFDLTNLSQVLDNVYLGDFSIFIAASELFLAGYENELSSIKRAIFEMDRKKIQSSAHKFKGSIGNFHDLGATEMARAIEHNAEQWTQEQLTAQHTELVARMTDFTGQLKMLCVSFAKVQQVA